MSARYQFWLFLVLITGCCLIIMVVNKKGAVLRILFIPIGLLLVFLAHSVNAMRGTEFLNEKDFALNVPYEVVDQEIRSPDGTFVVGIKDSAGVLKFYRLRELPMDRKFLRRINYVTQRAWYEPAPKGL